MGKKSTKEKKRPITLTKERTKNEKKIKKLAKNNDLKWEKKTNKKQRKKLTTKKNL